MVEEKYKKVLIEIIEKHLPNCKIILYGSRARGDNSPGSDIDVAIDAGKKLSRFVVYRIANEIEETKIPFFVDVLDLQSADEAIRGQIKKDGVIWKA